MKKSDVVSRVLDFAAGLLIGFLGLFAFLILNNFVYLPGMQPLRSVRLAEYEYGEMMPAEEKDAAIQSISVDLAESLINSGDKLYAQSSNPSDYSFEMVGYDTWVVYCSDEAIGVLTAENDLSGKRLMNYDYNSVPFSMRPDYVWDGPISDKPGWLYDRDVYR